MTTATTINLQDAGLFSSLAYAPNGVADSIGWGLKQTGTYFYQYAESLKAANWTDITGTLITLSGNPRLNFDPTITNTSFHVYQNGNSHQVVIAFRGSTPPGFTGLSLANWAADLTTSHQGFTSYQGIAPGALQALNLIEGSLGIPASNILVDGHSLGGGIAQTFAAANSLNGFAENPLPISPTALSNITGLSTQVAEYQTGNVFHTELLQGDVAAALYLGGTFLDTSPVWLSSSYEETETQLVNSMGTHWYSNIGGNTFADVSLLRTAIAGHNLDNLITQAAKQFSDDGEPRFGDIGIARPNSPSMVHQNHHRRNVSECGLSYRRRPLASFCGANARSGASSNTRDGGNPRTRCRSSCPRCDSSSIRGSRRCRIRFRER